MSEFFKNFEDEEKKPQKKHIIQYEDSSETRDMVSKKDKKLNELRKELTSLQDNINMKKLDTFIKNSKKYKTILREGLPDFAYDFYDKIMNNEKISNNIKSKANKFFEPYKKDNTLTNDIITPNEKKVVIEDDIEVILNNKILSISKLDDLEEQERQLFKLFKETNNVGMNFKLYFTLFNFYLKNKVTDYSKIMNVFMQIVELSKYNPCFMGIDFISILNDNLAYYLNYITDTLTDDNYDDFENKLNLVKVINEDVVSKIMLEYKFIKLNKNIETEDELFKLLYSTRKGDYHGAKAYYEAKNIYNANERSINVIINELAILAFKNDDLKFAFKLLQQCYLNNYYEGEVYLFVIAILIEEDIIDEPFYDYFLTTFKGLDENPFLCKSEDQKMEIQRAYYYLNNYDIDKACHILEKIISYPYYKMILAKKVVIQ